MTTAAPNLATTITGGNIGNPIFLTYDNIFDFPSILSLAFAKALMTKVAFNFILNSIYMRMMILSHEVDKTFFSRQTNPQHDFRIVCF